jgi:hypothetical protein
MYKSPFAIVMALRQMEHATTVPGRMINERLTAPPMLPNSPKTTIASSLFLHIDTMNSAS